MNWYDVYLQILWFLSFPSLSLFTWFVDTLIYKFCSICCFNFPPHAQMLLDLLFPVSCTNSALFLVGSCTTNSARFFIPSYTNPAQFLVPSCTNPARFLVPFSCTNPVRFFFPSCTNPARFFMYKSGVVSRSLLIYKSGTVCRSLWQAHVQIQHSFLIPPHVQIRYSLFFRAVTFFICLSYLYVAICFSLHGVNYCINDTQPSPRWPFQHE